MSVARHTRLFIVALLLGISCSSLAAQTSRLPIPPSAKVAEAKKTIAELYKKETAAAKTPADKRKLVAKLMEEAAKSRDDAPSQYALYDSAKTLAIFIGDAQTASAAVEKIGQRFEVDLLADQIDVARQVATTAKAGEDEYFLEQHLGTTALALANAARWKEALECCRLGQATAKKLNDGDLAKAWSERVAEFAAREKAAEELAPALALLEQSPADEAANASAGKLLCFALTDWKKGLPMLALAGDKTLQAAAEQELRAQSAVDRLAVADAWYDAAKTQTDAVTKRHMLRHALDLYRSAEFGLSSLPKSRAQARIAELFAEVMPDRIPLSTFRPSQYSVFAADQGPFMNAKIGGRYFRDSIWAHAPNSNGASQVVFDLPCEFKYLKGVCAFHDDIQPRTAVQFRANGDGKEIFRLRERLAAPKVLPFRIDLKGVKQIALIVDCPGDHHESWAIWVAPVLQK